MKRIDLHIHTNESDGCHTPFEIIKMAKAAQLDIICIADHDTVEGYLKARQLALDYGLDLLIGSELSCRYKNYDVHILAYEFDYEYHEIKAAMDFLFHGRVARAKQILIELKKLGIHIDYDAVIDLAGQKGLIGRPHIGRAVVNAGYCCNLQDVFDRFIGEGKPAFIPKPELTPKEMIDIIHNAGGYAVLAHPGKLKNQKLIPEIIKDGIDGLEVFYPAHNLGQTDNYLHYCQNHNIIPTCGSDYHGKDISNIELGNFTGPEMVYSYVKNMKRQPRGINAESPRPDHESAPEDTI
ncbi:MAG: PHP domain-containing protein [Candidatus Cloacimonetes bacterium]|nr:PHP domain-containing protein [Candidatus Cloacimonadota bacterium]